MQLKGQLENFFAVSMFVLANSVARDNLDIDSIVLGGQSEAEHGLKGHLHIHMIKRSQLKNSRLYAELSFR